MKQGVEARLSFVTLGVVDLARSTAFYSALGFTRGKALPTVTFFEMGHAQLALYPRARLAADAGLTEQEDAAPRATCRGFALSANVGSASEVRALLDAAARAGGRITKPARATEWGGYAGYFADPDGFLWEVAWNPKLPQLVPSLAGSNPSTRP